MFDQDCFIFYVHNYLMQRIKVRLRQFCLTKCWTKNKEIFY